MHQVPCDLTANATFDEKIDGCCKGGVLVSRVQGFNKSTAAFQIAVGGESWKNTTWRGPTNYTFVVPHGEYSCSTALVVAPTRFTSSDGRRITQAFRTWKVVRKYKPPAANQLPVCCVSLSSDQGVNTSCPICACSCQNESRTCFKGCRRDHGKAPPIECTDHMCPVNINWHVMSNVKENQRQIRVKWKHFEERKITTKFWHHLAPKAQP